MAYLTIHAGDFRKGRIEYYMRELRLIEATNPTRVKKFPLNELATVEIATEESVKRLGGTVGWGAAGALLLGPVGLLAGLLLGGRKKEVTFVARFKDGRKFLATTDPKVYRKLLSACF